MLPHIPKSATSSPLFLPGRSPTTRFIVALLFQKITKEASTPSPTCLGIVVLLRISLAFSCLLVPTQKHPLLPEMWLLTVAHLWTLGERLRGRVSSQIARTPGSLPQLSPKADPAGWALQIPFSPPSAFALFANGLQSLRHFPQTKPRLPNPAEAGSPVPQPKRQPAQSFRSHCLPQARRMRGAYT